MQVAQNQQKMYADRCRVERQFEVGDKVTRRIREVAYELQLPPGSKMHNIFNVSCLKKALGQQVATTTYLPLLDDEGCLELVLEAISEKRERKLRNRTIREFLVKWKDLPKDTTWEVLTTGVAPDDYTRSLTRRRSCPESYRNSSHI